uniref:Endo-1,4-beta-xylanase n=1 Tax=uncultured bacterium contig00008 TaxID=1181500 RepID=A0A806JZA7_9BACT|nr:endo-1,4-beta-xylanase [uncultured bacterium contig00008]
MKDDDPYFRSDPGPGLQRIPVYKFDIKKDFNTWKPWRTNDGRVLPNSKCSFTAIESPFEEDDRLKDSMLVMLTVNYAPDLTKRSFGGFGMRVPIKPALAVNNQSFVEFDLYYAESAVDKYMRFEFWSTSSGGEGAQAKAGSRGEKKTQIYIRTGDLEGVYMFNLDYRCGYYNNETWYKKPISAVVPVPSGTWEYLNIDLHTETDVKVDKGILMIGNLRITQTDPNGVPIPDVVNAKSFSEVTPIREKYNQNNGNFLIGSNGDGTIAPDSLGGYHFEIFVSYENLKPDIHIRPPQWLRDEYPGFVFKPDDEGPEWDMPTEYYTNIKNAGKTGGYKFHGYCLAWHDMTPYWMRQIIPENITSMIWNENGYFYAGSKSTEGPFQSINKNTARRIHFNHIMYEMRHFMTTDTRYDSSQERGIIPFHSFDVVNAEIHESRHSILIQKNVNEWKTALKHTSWLMAVMDNDFKDIRQHYIYLLYKYAHIAVPNAQMAAKFKAGYGDPDIVPGYMKLDNHDNNGSIDAYVSEKPPILVYNDYGIVAFSKAKVIYNMIKDLNAAWKLDPLYDGRNLIECFGIQGHDSVNPTTASLNQQAVILFTSLIDEGLLDCICYSELDIRQLNPVPGGEAHAPNILNQKQADVIGYQYALFFKMFEKFKKYIDHVIIWSQFGASYQDSYVLFDDKQMASQAYYAVMDPDKFIKGHSYLDSYFSGEYEKIKGA